MSRKIRTYSELIRLATFEERFEYLSLNGSVGFETFGSDRYLNQRFYQSTEWRRLRNQIILRDNGCDLAVAGIPISGTIQIHHINPIFASDIKDRTEFLLNPEYLVCVSMETHNALHYSDISLIGDHEFHERRPGDTKLW